MKRRTKLTTLFFSLILVVGALFVVFNTNDAQARQQSEICEYAPTGGLCGGDPVNCACEIVVTPDDN